MERFKERFCLVGWVVLAALVVFGALAGLMAVLPRSEPVSVVQQSASGYLLRLEDGTGSAMFSVSDAGNAVVAGSQTVGGGYGSTGCTISSAGVLQCDGAATLDGGVTGAVAGDVTGALTLAADDFVTLTPGTSITVTNGAAFTPTATYQPIVAASEVTPTITAGATAGRVVMLTNTGTDVVNLADSGTLKLSAAGALGQYDSLTIVSDGTNWIEVARSDN